MRVRMILPPLIVAAVISAGMLVLAPAAAGATQAARAPLLGPDDLPGALAGTVLSVGGTGLGGVCVLTKGPSGVRVAVTAPDGRYGLADMAAGRYVVRYSYCRHPEAYRSLWYSGQGGSLTPAGLVLVRPGQLATLRPVTLRPANPAAAMATSLAASRRAFLRARDAGRRRPVISGTVRSAASGRVLAGICVIVVPVARSNRSDRATTTGRHGRYAVSGYLPPGRYRVGFSSGCHNPGNYAPQWWKGALTEARARVLRVRRGSSFKGIDARLGRGGSISGIVRGGSPAGPGLPGVCILLVARTLVGPNEPAYDQGTTGAGGRYRLAGLPTGKYQVQFDPTCYGNGSFTYLPENYPRRVPVTAGKATSGIDIVLPKGGSISGTITARSTGKPVPGICVIAAGPGPNDIMFAASNSSGRYNAGFLGAGDYAVEFFGGLCGNSGSYAPQYYNDLPYPVADVPLATAQNVTGINASLRPGGTIKGRVTTTSGAPSGGICATATDQGDWAGYGPTPAGLYFGGLTLIGINTAASESNGGYRIANMSPGLYNLNFSECRSGRYAAEWFHPGGGPGPAWISVVGGQPVRANAALPAAGSISGVIKSPTGKPRPNICPETFGLGGQVPFVYVNGGSASISNKAGVYRLGDLAPGRYAVEFVPCGLHADIRAATWYKTAANEGASIKITVRRGRDTSGIDPVMSAGQVVTGRIRSAVTGRPVAGECVEALSSPDDIPRYVTTDSTGAFLLDLLPGKHTLAVFQCTSSNQLGPALRRISVRARTVVDVALPRQGAIGGTLLIGRVAVPGVCVEAAPVSGTGLAGMAVTGPRGGYLMSGLAPGLYRVRFASACPFAVGGLAPQLFPGLVRVRSGVTAQGVGAVLMPDGGIAGSVRVSGEPVAGVCAIAVPAGRGAPVAVGSAAGGSYQIEDLAPGIYKVEFTAGCGRARYRTQWYNGARTAAAATVIRVSPGKITAGIDER